MNKLKILQHLHRLNEKLEILFDHQIKFDPKFFKAIDQQKLEILALVMHKTANVSAMSERKRRKFFWNLLKELKIKKLSFKEIENFYIAFGFPKKKQTVFQRDLKEAVYQLIENIKEDFTKNRVKRKRYEKKKNYRKKKGEKI